MYRIHQITSKGLVKMIINRGLLNTQKIQRSYCSSKKSPTCILFKPRNPSMINVKSKTSKTCSPFKSRGVLKFGFSLQSCTADKDKISCEKKTPKSCSEAKPKPTCDKKEPPPTENLSCEKKKPPVTKKPCAPTTEQTKASSSTENSSCEKKEPPATKKSCAPTTEQTKASSPAENSSCEKKKPTAAKKPCAPTTEQTKASSPAENSSCKKKEPPETKKPCEPTTEQPKASSPMSSEQKKQSQTKTTCFPETNPQDTISSLFKSHDNAVTLSTPNTPPQQTDNSNASKTQTNTNVTAFPVKSLHNTRKTTAITTSKTNTPDDSLIPSKLIYGALIFKPKKSTSSDSKKFLKRGPISKRKKTRLATAAHTKHDKSVPPPMSKKPKTSIEKIPSSNIIYDFKRDPPIEKGFVEIPNKSPLPIGPPLSRNTTSTSKKPHKRSKIDSNEYVNNYIQRSIKSNVSQPSKAVTKAERVDALMRPKEVLRNILNIESGNKKIWNLKTDSKRKSEPNLKVINDKKTGVDKKYDTGKKANARLGDVLGEELNKKNYLIRPHFNDKDLQRPSTADSQDPKKPKPPPSSPEPPKKTYKPHNVYSENTTENFGDKIDSEKICEELADQFHSDETFSKDQNSTKSPHQNSEFQWLRPSQDQPKKTFMPYNTIFETLKNVQTNNSAGEDLALKESLQRLELEMKRSNDIMQVIDSIPKDEIKIRLIITHDNEPPPSTSTITTSSHKSHGNLTKKWDPKSPSGSRGKHTYAKLISDFANRTISQTKSLQISPDREIEAQVETKDKPLELLQAAIARSLQKFKVFLFNKDR